MFSQQARTGIDQIFRKVAKSAFVIAPEHACSVSAIGDTRIDRLPGKEVIVLTLSSLLFRIVLLLHVDDTASARTYYAHGGDGARDLNEALAEVLNLCSGAMNRELLRYFPYLGMSTPYRLDSRCLAHLGQLKPDQISSYELAIEPAGARLHVSLALCAYAPIDFAVDLRAEREETGELELF